MNFLSSKKTALLFSFCFVASGCGQTKRNPQAEAPPLAKVEHEQDIGLVKVDHPEQFPLVGAVEHDSFSELTAAGMVSPDVSRIVPVISIATGRVVEIKARLGDFVKKGQLLLRVQSADLSSALSDYRKAAADEQLSRTQLDREELLYNKGAVSLNELQVAQDAETKAKADVENSTERLRVLGGNIDQQGSVVDIRAPVSGFITDQQVTNAAGVAGLNTPNPFTISDLSRVWILVDVYENNLASVHVGQHAEIRLNAYPGKVFTGRIDSIAPVLDLNLRTAKVRIEVNNPGLVMRVGMFALATFHERKKECCPAVPAAAVLHLHDRDWVFVPAGSHAFRRVEVIAGAPLADDMVELRNGLHPGELIVGNALVLRSAVEQ